MLSIDEAWQCVDDFVSPLPSLALSPLDAFGLVLAKDLDAPIDLPPFDNSAVDGFALAARDIERASAAHSVALPMQGMLAAGEAPNELSPGQTFRIMTGAPLMSGADTVVMQEQVDWSQTHARFSAPQTLGANIRKAGEDVRWGERVANAGDIVDAAKVALFCALGMPQVPVHRKPRVAILSTGSELVLPGEPLGPGQVYYCTGPTLAALVLQWGGEVVMMDRVEDKLEATIAKTRLGLEADLLLVVGGMSVGEYDFARQAFEALGVRTHFYQGKWRPGKPLFFGEWQGKPVLGIPGNPVACFVMAHLFVRRVLQGLMGHPPRLPWQTGHLAHVHLKKPWFSFFARARADEQGGLSLALGQGSHELGSLARANALCWLEEDASSLNVGDRVHYLAL